MAQITTKEYEHRLERLQKSLEEHGLKAFLVSSRENIHYLTGVVYETLERPSMLLVKRAAPSVFLVPLLECDHVRTAPNVHQIVRYREFPASNGERWSDKLRDMLSGIEHLGVDPSLSQTAWEVLEDVTPQRLPVVESLRAVKSPNEIELIRRAAQYADQAVRRLLAASYHNSTVAEGLAQTRKTVRSMIRELRDDWNPLTTRVLMATWAAPRSAQPHSIPKLSDRLLDGPHVALALTAYKAYAAECERTYFTRRPSDDDRRAFAAMTEARRRAFAMVRPGARCSEIDRATNEFLTQEGYAEKLLHRTGHGFGLAQHAEAPWLAEGSDAVLAPDMVLSIEPGIYIPKVGGYRHSDTVLVTDSSHETLTNLPTDFDELIVTGLKPSARARGAIVRRALQVR